MPHYKDGRKAYLYDPVRFPQGLRYLADGEKTETIFADGRVIQIDAGAKSCELTILVGSGLLLGLVNLPQFPGDPHQPRQGVILSGYYTSANAAECELLPRFGE